MAGCCCFFFTAVQEVFEAPEIQRVGLLCLSLEKAYYLSGSAFIGEVVLQGGVQCKNLPPFMDYD